MKRRIIFAGSGEFGLPSLRALIQDGHDIVQIVSQPDRQAGRGREWTATPVAAFASSQNLPLLKTANINRETLVTADLMVVIAFGQKIEPHIVNHAQFGSVNLHASHLPKYRGAAPINWAIIRGENYTGNSIIRLAQKMDAGAILAQSKLAIGEMETAGELHDRLATDGATIVTRTVLEIFSGVAKETPQDDSQATLAPKLSREHAKIDFARPAIEICNQIRGMHPWPGCRVRLLDDTNELGRMTLVRARSIAAGETRVGLIEPSGAITSGKDAIEIVELQPEGGRVMTLPEFRNGHPWKPGMRLESI